MWNGKRIRETAFRLLKEGRLSVEGLIHPIVPFEESDKEYHRIGEAPGECIKLGVVYFTNIDIVEGYRSIKSKTNEHNL